MSTTTTIDRKQFDQIRKREFQLTVVAAVFVFVLSVGEAALMYPLVFVHPEAGNIWTLRVAFFGFCALAVLFVIYLVERQYTVNKLKKTLLEQWERNIELRFQASADLLQNMPDLNHFWDRLTMEYRRALTMQQTMSLLTIGAKLGLKSGSESEKTEAWGDIAKAMARNLRPTDSIYRLAPDLFGVVLPGTSKPQADRVATRLLDGLNEVKFKHGCVFETGVHNYPDDVKSSHEFEQIVKALLPEQEDWAVPVPTP
jgi:GGDEF domain-containing protein